MKFNENYFETLTKRLGLGAGFSFIYLFILYIFNFFYGLEDWFIQPRKQVFPEELESITLKSPNWRQKYKDLNPKTVTHLNNLVHLLDDGRRASMLVKIYSWPAVEKLGHY